MSRSGFSRAVKLGFAAGLALALATAGGCANLGYYFQSVSGHLDLLGRRQPIELLLADPATAPALSNKLSAVLRLREFASRDLALPENGSYRQYADLQRPFVVWNVFAAPELSTQLREWCFPVAGCVAYRGYFDKAQAEAFAASLRAEGLDVFVNGVPAYSTLGWFDDPVLNTFVHYPDTELARIIFHELAHQVVYVKNDTVFNESFATAVENEGMGRWLAARASDAERRAHAAAQERKQQFIALTLKYRKRLAEHYGSPAPDAEKRGAKAQLLAAMREEYLALKQGWGGFAGYDRWFQQQPNNATLASVAAYTEMVPAFERLLAKAQGDLPRFYGAVKEIGKLPKEERQAKLAVLAGEGPLAERPR